MAASKKPAKPAASKAAKKPTKPRTQKVELTQDEVQRRKRKEILLDLIDQGLPVPKALQQEFVPVEDEPAQASAQTDEGKPRIIRNLRNVPVHMRLDAGRDKPYRVALEPRGTLGDVAQVPAICAEDTAFAESFRANLFEIITSAERASISYDATPHEHVLLDPKTGQPVRMLPTTSANGETVATYQIDTTLHGPNAGHITANRVGPQQMYVPGAVQPAPQPSANSALPAPVRVEGDQPLPPNAGGGTAMPDTLPVFVSE